ncbi:uncharacterized protein AKAME5_001777300 [Lates japonicus]|uniref:ZP domain-containing protein n=1 Tax=Lates japonicus TaxID=270547 RepID=A0AAD3RF56_LATJO|nr:uncharacterized protein AKAME5_001777300 [Lates japonicus]
MIIKRSTSRSVSLGQWGDESTDTRWEKTKQLKDVQQGKWHLVEEVIRGADLRKTIQPGLQGFRPESAPFPGEPLPYITVPKLDETGSSSAPSSLSWTFGNISTERRAPASDSKDGYQADFTGFHGVQGKVLGPTFDSSPHFSEWLAMRPLVQCDENVMTFTASGQGLTHLLVDREGASPISLFQLPPYCRYSVRTSWSDLEMMVPYDACYITQENGSYVLPMLWWGSPLKLSCPVLMSTPAPSLSLSAPSVFCSPYGMAVQIHGQDQDIPLLGVVVNGGWGPFVSEECAYRVHSEPDELTFFIFYTAPCITNRVAQLPDYPYDPYPGLQYPQLPQVYPPGPQPVRPHQPTPGSPPGPQPQPQQQQEQLSLNPMGPGKFPYSPGEHPKYPSPPYQPSVVVQATSAPNLSPEQDSYSHQVSKLPLGPSQYPSALYYPHVPFYYPVVPTAPTPMAQKTTTTTVPPATLPPRPPAHPYYPQYHLQMPYYPAPTAAPVTQAPAPLPPSSSSSPPRSPQYQVGPFYPSSFYGFYYPYGPISYIKPGVEVQPPSASHPTTAPPPTTNMMAPKQPVSPSYPSGHFYPQGPIYFPPPTPPPPAKEKPQTIPQEPQTLVAPQATCPPYTHTICSYYSYPYHPYYHHPFYPPHYHPPYPPVPHEQRLPCGPASVSQPQCLSMGCCFSKHPPACYYPMDECTIDRHFVFSVPASLTEPPLSPALLVTASNSTCTPQRVTPDYALFKIPMDGCGARRVTVGKTVIYMVEVINKVQAISLNYGTITRDSPVRLLVECRFQPGTVLTVSYLVKTPTLGPRVQTQGVFGVQLRIAKDAQYSSYYPQYHQPLQMLLGKPLYLEVRLLNAPDPSLVLLVHFCVAYPRSGKSVWVLLYNGCPNPLDPAPQQAVLSDPPPPFPQGHTRRFTISTFQFLPDGEFKDPDEEIYFMCSTEICSPRDGPCVEGCFGQ